MRTRTRTVLLANAALLALSVCVLEFIFGDWFGPDGVYRLSVPAGRTLYYTVRYAPGAPPVRVTYSRDKFGLRGTYPDIGAIDLLAVGGSTTDEARLSDGQTWTDHLQARFAAAGRTFHVANAGVTGHSTYGHIRSFEKWFPRIPGLRPRYVLFYVGINDVMVDHAVYDRLQDYTNTYTWVRYAQDRSALWSLYRMAKGTWLARRQHLDHRCEDFSRYHWTTRGTLADPAAEYADAIRAYGRRLRTLADLARNMGALPIFVTQPRCYWRFRNGVLEGIEETVYEGTALNGVDIYRIQRLMDREMETVARETGSRFVDLAAAIGLSQADFFDFNHVNPSGARRVADFLYEHLKDLPQTPACVPVPSP